jgi:FHS family L-fucose permease-like MFS transporter
MLSSPTSHSVSPQNNSKNYNFALVVMASLFFTFGFITCLNDILSPYLQKLLKLSYTQTAFIQFAFFGAYFVISPPSIWIVNKIGHKKSASLGLIITGIGCLLFLPASYWLSYAIFLFALFVLAGGIALLQTATNPYISILGDAKSASSRLTLVQAFNSLGTTIAPLFGGALILANLKNITDASALYLPYVSLGMAFFVLATIVMFTKLPVVSAQEQLEENAKEKQSVWQYNHLVLGAIGIFMYVGAEVSIGTYLVKYIGLSTILGLEEEKAANYVAMYWGGAMVGRFLGSYIMQKVLPHRVLMVYALLSVFLLFIGVFMNGIIAMWSILSIGFFNSIMFPTIFTLAIKGLGKHTEAGSGILCMAIFGGAVVPVFQGMLADDLGLQISFLLPVICYIYIAFFGLKGYKEIN